MGWRKASIKKFYSRKQRVYRLWGIQFIAEKKQNLKIAPENMADY